MIHQAARQKVAVAGIGVGAAPGFGRDDFWAGVIDGRTNQRPIEHFTTARSRGLPVHTFPPSTDLPPLDDPERLTEALALVIDEARLQAGWTDLDDVGLVVGTTNVADLAFERHLSGAEADGRVLHGALGSRLAERVGLGGPSLTICTASTTGAAVVSVGCGLIEAGDCERVLAVAGDTICMASFAGLSALRTLTAEGCRPFSSRRRGIMIAEMAGAMALERDDDHAGLKVHGHSVINMANDPVRPESLGIAQAIRNCLGQRGEIGSNELAAADGLASGDVVPGYVNVHGPGTGTEMPPRLRLWS